MGTFNKGILGGFSGKVGTVVGASWRGIDIMRSLPKKTDRTPTDSQLAVRIKFKLITQFLGPIRTIVARYFGQPQGYRSRRNLATSYHIANAIGGVFPDFTIKFDNVVLTKGEVIAPQEPVVTPQANAALAFTWEDNSGQVHARTDDMLLVVAYNETRNMFQTQEQAAVRTALTYTMDLPDAWAGDSVQLYIAFTNAEGTKCSTSIYMGAAVLL